jgi:predicted Zn-dependent protease
VAANFAGAWSMGDYSLCYDLLSRENPVLEGQSRDEWITTRRAWADEAQPARFEMYFLREHEPQSQQSALWLPTAILSTRTRNASKEIALGWSLALRETQLSGTLPEMQMGTAVYKETGRYWFWTIFTLEQVQGEWRIARIKDEGAAIQALPVEELEKRIQEHDEAIQKIMREHRPNEADGQQYYEEILWRSWQSLSLADALLVKKPQEKALYESAYGRAMSLRAVERAAVYAEALVKRFPDDPDHKLLQQQLGAVLIALSERFAALHLPEQAGQFRELGETTLRATLSQDDPLSYLLVAELLIGQQKYEEAERLLLDAREVAQEEQVKVQVESDLAHLAITLKRYPEAQQYLERVAALTPNEPGLWYLLGSVQRQQNNLAEAETSLQRSLADEPNEIRAYGELGSLYLDQREFEKAIDILGQGLRLAPQFADLHALMAIVYVEKGDLRRAREYLNSAEALDPELEILPAIGEAIAAKKK